MEDKLRSILKEHGRLSVDPFKIATTDNLYELGLGSHSSISVMLAVERAFQIEFPDERLRKSTFESISSLAYVVRGLQNA